MENTAAGALPNGDGVKRHLDTMSTSDIMERYKHVEASVRGIDAELQAGMEKLQALERNRDEAEAERQALGRVLVKRLGLGDLLSKASPKRDEPQITHFAAPSESRVGQINPRTGAPYKRGPYKPRAKYTKRENKSYGCFSKGESPNDRDIVQFFVARGNKAADIGDIWSGAFPKKGYFAVVSAITFAHRRGVVERVGRGIYRLTATTRAQAEAAAQQAP